MKTLSDTLKTEFEKNFSTVLTSFNSSLKSVFLDKPPYLDAASKASTTLKNIYQEIAWCSPSREFYVNCMIGLLGTQSLLSFLTQKNLKNHDFKCAGSADYAFLTPFDQKFDREAQNLNFLDGLNMRLHETVPFIMRQFPPPFQQHEKKLEQLFTDLKKDLELVWQACENIIINQLIEDLELQNKIKTLNKICMMLTIWDIPDEDKNREKADQCTSSIQTILTNLKNRKNPNLTPKGDPEDAKQTIKLFTPQAIIDHFESLKFMFGLSSSVGARYSSIPLSPKTEPPKPVSPLVASSLTAKNKKKDKTDKTATPTAPTSDVVTLKK